MNKRELRAEALKILRREGVPENQIPKVLEQCNCEHPSWICIKHPLGNAGKGK